MVLFKRTSFTAQEEAQSSRWHLFFPLLKEVNPLCFNYIWDFSCQLSATHFCDGPNTPARYVPCGWEGKAFVQLL